MQICQDKPKGETMNLNEAVNRIGFDIREGEDEIVDMLVEAYNAEPDKREFVYKSRKYLDKVDEARIGQFIARIGKSKLFVLAGLHEAFDRYYQKSMKTSE